MERTNLLEPTSLEQIEKDCSMLKRSENKYIVDESILDLFFESCNSHFRILEIEGVRRFKYITTYFDDSNICFIDHQRGKRRRFKARTRLYPDTDLCFFEIKLKGMRGRTEKRRIRIPCKDHGSLDDEKLRFIKESMKDFYNKDFDLNMEKTLEMSFTRMQLALKEGGERVTVDQNIAIEHFGRRVILPKNLAIIETKSRNGNGIGDKILRSLHQHPVDGCSKYCIGRSCIDDSLKRNRFKPVLKRIGLIKEEDHIAELHGKFLNSFTKDHSLEA